MRIERLSRFRQRAQNGLAACAIVLAPPVLRIALALPFLRSGLTRWDPFPHLALATTYLFEYAFKLHLFGHEVSLPAPLVAAYATSIAEIALPALLLLGLGTRWAALGLLLMTAVIQLVVPEGWRNYHLYWAAIALAIIALGPGGFSVDALLRRRAARGG